MVTNKLLRYSCEEHYFSAALCRMCLDPADAAINLDKYIEAFPAFEDTRRHKLLKVSCCKHIIVCVL